MEARIRRGAAVTVPELRSVIYLDANFLIDALVAGSEQEAQIVQWLEAGESLGISAIAWGEFLCGPLSPAAEVIARQLFFTVTPLERVDAEKAAALFNLTGRRSRSFADCCIAAIAVRMGALLATGNRSDFLLMVDHGLELVSFGGSNSAPASPPV